jgi:hypothetical protein
MYFSKSEGLSNNKKKSQNHTINKPIMSSSPNEIWDWLHKYGQLCSANGGIDRGNSFLLLSIILVERCGYVPLKSQTAINVRNALINIVADTKTYPRIVQADNGRSSKGNPSLV